MEMMSLYLYFDKLLIVSRHIQPLISGNKSDTFNLVLMPLVPIILITYSTTVLEMSSLNLKYKKDALIIDLRIYAVRTPYSW